MKKASLDKKYLFERYHKAVKYNRINKNKTFIKGQEPSVWKTIYFKSYPRLDEQRLPLPEKLSKVSFVVTLENRKSTRDFGSSGLGLKQLSTLLYYTAGINKNHPIESRRFYPSGGARFPLEVYLLSLKTSLPKGLYHYYPRNHSLETLLSLQTFNFKKAFSMNNQDWITKSAAVLVITALFKRSAVKYGELAYKLILLEAGHMGQNCYLVSPALGIGCCAVAGINDNYFEELLDIDGESESIVYCIALGSKSLL